jgi:hypothetical protein
MRSLSDPAHPGSTTEKWPFQPSRAPAFTNRRCQNIGVGGARCREPYPSNVVSGRFERRHGGAR